MPFDFDQIIDRRNTNSYKWDVKADELPMWVADMDFQTAPAIVRTIEERLKQGTFGYNTVPESFQESIIRWWQTRHQFTMKKEWILYCTGVVPAISSIVRKMTEIGDNVVVLSPVYNIFYNSILNNQRNVLASELRYEEGAYAIDYEDLEEKMARSTTSLFIFCNPHNPIGKVWDRQALERIADLCIKHNVLIVSDEIHCDLTHSGHTYTPFASISEEIADQTITCLAPTKAFNIAGLQTAAIVIPNPEIRKLVDRGINTDEVAEPNTFAIQAAEAAFNEGEEWLEELRGYLERNRKALTEILERFVPEVSVVQAEATYLAWIDCTAITSDTKKLCAFIREKTGLYLSEGDIFGGNGARFVRWNYACPKALLDDGIQRFVKGVALYKKEGAR
ncbi:aminotransferase class i/classii [Trichococcus palustris]|uniref:cysteine-S-conjugate beta-lyase n=1 Tax=Trichococcus palustris TaxID=140314 RepID=A0A143YJ74_9LACT|nr:MalY/PatB family protein [Trichococcus palustris]CZQ89716.1 aminotransferase class i/classii [Trichococcus palustris]SFK98338.1 cystathione beta-lyase [Trichococcus palustris]